jgi:hypothetical protein
MSITLSTGTSVSIAATYGADKTFSAASNASECVLTFAADPSLAANDIIEVSSAWGRLDQRVVRVKTVTGAGPYSVTLEGVNTSDTDDYSGSGAGTIREIATWSEITQIKSISTSGGDQQFADVTSIVDVVARQMPTIRSAVSMELEVFDDPTLAYYAIVTAASDAAVPTALKMSFPNGSKLYANDYWSIQREPSISANEAITSKISLSHAAQSIRYTA